jgi:ketosteroid isomerase-like protein
VTADPIALLDRSYRMVWHEADLEGAFRDVSDDFEWVVPGHPEGAVRRGPEGAIAFFRDWLDAWEDVHVEWELHPIDDERVLAVTTQRARGRGSGVPVELRFAQLWTVRDGLAVRMVLFADVEKGFAAAGLRP